MASNNSTAASFSGTIHRNALMDILSGFIAFSSLATIVFNGLILMVFCRDRALRTEFNAYVANLCTAEVLLAVTAMPGTVIRGLYGYWPLGFDMCSLFLYSMDVFGSAVRYGHVLIALNRVWAVAFPVHYRKHHTMFFVECAIGTMWTAINVLHLSVLIPARLRPIPNDEICIENVKFQQAAAAAKEILGFTFAEIVMLSACALTAFRLHAIRKPSPSRNPGAQAAASCTQPKIPSTDKATYANAKPALMALSRPPTPRLRISGAESGTHHLSHGEERSEKAARPGPVPNLNRAKESRTQKFSLLGYLAAAVIVCWTPNHVYWLMVDIGEYWNDTFRAVQSFLNYANSWINPILCYMALRQIRRAINATLGLNRSN